MPSVGACGRRVLVDRVEGGPKGASRECPRETVFEWASRSEVGPAAYLDSRVHETGTARMTDEAASQQIDDIIEKYGDWRGQMMSQLRAVINRAAPDVLEEVKWKKPSRPEGVPVWSHDGILCVCDTLKNAVRLTFPKGARITDPKGLFNTRLESKAVRAVDFREGDTVDEAALTSLVLEAIRLNTS